MKQQITKKHCLCLCTFNVFYMRNESSYTCVHAKIHIYLFQQRIIFNNLQQTTMDLFFRGDSQLIISNQLRDLVNRKIEKFFRKHHFAANISIETLLSVAAAILQNRIHEKYAMYSRNDSIHEINTLCHLLSHVACLKTEISTRCLCRLRMCEVRDTHVQY